MDRLIRLGLIEKLEDGRFRKTRINLMIESETFNEFFSSFTSRCFRKRKSR